MGRTSAGEVSTEYSVEPREAVLTGLRIRSANILLITVKALANEVAKNLVLAGIGSLTIIDHEPVTEVDLDAQFFLEEAHKDENITKNGKNVRPSPPPPNSYGSILTTPARRGSRPSNPPHESPS